jgi:hypothetical protein
MTVPRGPAGFDADAFRAWCAATPDVVAFERRLARVPAAARPAVVAGLRATLAAAVGAPAAGETNAQGRDRRGRAEVRRQKLDVLARLAVILARPVCWLLGHRWGYAPGAEWPTCRRCGAVLRP